MRTTFKHRNLILPVAFLMTVSCHSSKQQAAVIPKSPTTVQPAIAVNTKDTTAKKNAHADHRDEGYVKPASGAAPSANSKPEAEVAKPDYKQHNTFAPKTLKNAPKSGN